MIRSLKRINIINKSLILFFINRFIRNGTKSILYKIFLKVLIRLKKRFKQTFNFLLNEIIEIISPLVQLKPKFSSGIVYMIPDYPHFNKSLVLGLSFFVKAIKLRREYQIYYRLLYEFRDILKYKGLTLKYKREFHKLALSNRHLLFKFSRK